MIWLNVHFFQIPKMLLASWAHVATCWRKLAAGFSNYTNLERQGCSEAGSKILLT
jgi:hypothetical protein